MLEDYVIKLHPNVLKIFERSGVYFDGVSFNMVTSTSVSWDQSVDSMRVSKIQAIHVRVAISEDILPELNF